MRDRDVAYSASLKFEAILRWWNEEAVSSWTSSNKLLYLNTIHTIKISVSYANII